MSKIVQDNTCGTFRLRSLSEAALAGRKYRYVWFCKETFGKRKAQHQY